MGYLHMLHDKFLAETDIDCHYATFAKYVPVNIVKPSASDWGTCLCKLRSVKDTHNILGEFSMLI